MIKFYKLTVLSLVAGLLFSCSDDFVDIDPPYSIDSDSYFESEEDYNNALIGAYDVLQSTYANVILGEIASDNTHAGGESASDTPGWQQIDRMEHTPINDNLDDIWDWNFAGVQRATFIIANEDNIDFQGKEQIIAEARFLRAYFNFELVKWFGPIPIKETQFELGEVTSIPRSPVEEVYDFIEEDLAYAIDNMAVEAPVVGRATRGTAQALLGKAHLYQDEVQQAAENLQAVINSGQYHLYGTQEGEEYDSLFEYTAENSAESVFEIQYTGEEGAGFGCLQCSEGNVMVGFSGIRGYSGPVFEPGYGFNLPTQEAYDAFSENDARRDVSILDIEAWQNANPSVVYNIGNQSERTGHTGYYNRKYLPRQNDNLRDNNLTQPNNYRAIRYADVLLMAAEALARSGSNTGLANEYLNSVRERANLEPVQLSGVELLNQIYEDRRLEMIGEGHRFFDLVRTDRAEGTIQGFQSPKNDIFPEPLEEIQFSQGNWSQNPGY